MFASYASDPAVTRYLNWRAYSSVPPLAKFFQTCVANWETGSGPFTWLLFLRETETPIGSIGVTLERGKAMFGYVLAKEVWHRGLAVDQCRAGQK